MILGVFHPGILQFIFTNIIKFHGHKSPGIKNVYPCHSLHTLSFQKLKKARSNYHLGQPSSIWNVSDFLLAVNLWMMRKWGKKACSQNVFNNFFPRQDLEYFPFCTAPFHKELTSLWTTPVNKTNRRVNLVIMKLWHLSTRNQSSRRHKSTC